MHFELWEQLSSLAWSVQKDKKHPFFQEGRKQLHSTHTSSLFSMIFDTHSLHMHPSYSGEHTLSDYVCLIISVWYREHSFSMGDGKQSES